MLSQIKAWFIIVLDTVFGKWFARGLGPPSDHVHPEAAGSTVIVTGSTSGIGLETAKSLAGGSYARCDSTAECVAQVVSE